MSLKTKLQNLDSIKGSDNATVCLSYFDVTTSGLVTNHEIGPVFFVKLGQNPF